ncbi:MAG: ECF transporter S component [Lachnospiraceae bacterium]|nr:ECF transporter S component [Lachnospiraceae bacterium]
MKKEKTAIERRISVYRICVIALAVCINLVGGQIALVLRLPIYLDSIGTIFVGSVLGPIYGMLPNLLSGLIFGMTTDIYSLYYAPVGMLLGLMAGLVWKKKNNQFWWIFPAALVITIPGTLVSSCITAWLFGGITSSGSTILVQLLAKTPLGLTASVFVVQILTDYLDRLISMWFVIRLLKVLPGQLLSSIKNR